MAICEACGLDHEAAYAAAMLEQAQTTKPEQAEQEKPQGYTGIVLINIPPEPTVQFAVRAGYKIGRFVEQWKAERELNGFRFGKADGVDEIMDALFGGTTLKVTLISANKESIRQACEKLSKQIADLVETLGETYKSRIREITK